MRAASLRYAFALIDLETAQVLELVAAGETDRGLLRDTNEDALLIRADLGLYVVADGAGGHNAGNVASAIATSTIGKHFDSTEARFREGPEINAFSMWTAARRLSWAVHRANAAVIEIARAANKYRGMGTTVVCLLAEPEAGRVHIAHVGDSRCYRLRHGVFERLTDDHSLITDVLEMHPEFDDEVIAKLPRSAVTRALGMEMSLRVKVRTTVALPGDRYLLCSDGLTGELDDASLSRLVSVDASPTGIVGNLVRAAKDAGGRDNITALVVDCRTTVPPRAVKQKSSPKPLPRPVTKTTESEPEVTASETELDDPEIVLILTPNIRNEESEPFISVVPTERTDATMIRSLDRLATAINEPATKCVECGTEFAKSSGFCPRCGYAHIEPLSKR